MEAVVLAGGKGTRLAPYTTILPKPLMPVGGRPILGVMIAQLQQAGVTKITIAVNHMAEIIMAVFGNGERYGVRIDYSIETVALGTIGPLKLIKDLPENFLLMNGDLLTNLDYAALYRAHEASACLLTTSAHRREVKIDFGVLEVDTKTHRLVGFQEKPVFPFDVSMGIHVMNRGLLDRVPAGIPYGMDTLVLEMLRAKTPINVYPFSDYWLDIGRPDDFERANLEIESLSLTVDK
jgi:NDP-sugar pyrophosphorylase family protein